MAAMAQLCCSPLASNNTVPNPHSPPLSQCSRPKFLKPNLESKFKPLHAAGGGGGGAGIRSNGGGGGGGDSDPDGSKSFWDGLGPIGAFLKGWRERVVSDPQFPFKVLMEELVGVSACIVGDMASRPNFGLDELDFVFSTVVVGSILNLLLMYMLAPTPGSVSRRLPWVFAGCPTSHMFDPGAYTLWERLGTFVYKGAVFGAAGFGAGVVGTLISNGLIKMRTKMDAGFEAPNKPPPTLLNAFAWAVQLGVSSNLRYQGLNAVEYVLAKALPLYVFKALVVVLRCFNNVLGGMSFVAVARWTGSQVVV